MRYLLSIICLFFINCSEFDSTFDPNIPMPALYEQVGCSVNQIIGWDERKDNLLVKQNSHMISFEIKGVERTLVQYVLEDDIVVISSLAFARSTVDDLEIATTAGLEILKKYGFTKSKPGERVDKKTFRQTFYSPTQQDYTCMMEILYTHNMPPHIVVLVFYKTGI
jgi:hypothetical protein